MRYEIRKVIVGESWLHEAWIIYGLWPHKRTVIRMEISFTECVDYLKRIGVL